MEEEPRLIIISSIIINVFIIAVKGSSLPSNRPFWQPGFEPAADQHRPPCHTLAP